MGWPGGKAKQLSWNTRDQQGRLTFLSPEVASPLRPVGSVFSLTSCKRRRAAVDRPLGWAQETCTRGPIRPHLSLSLHSAQPSSPLTIHQCRSCSTVPKPWVRDPLKPGTCLIGTCCPRAWHSSRENTQLRAYSTQASKELSRSHGDHNFNYPPPPLCPQAPKALEAGPQTSAVSYKRRESHHPD